MPTKKQVDDWVAQSRSLRARMKIAAENNDREEIMRVIADLDDHAAATQSLLDDDDA